MVLDDGLLAKARETAADVAESDRQALLARAEYHSAIRRLHLGGGSLREIAQALGISHQRVQQMVEQAGGSWWQRIWKSRSVKRDAVCTFCERPPSEVKKLVAGPNVYLCDGCIGNAALALDGNRVKGVGVAKRASQKCSFCGQKGGAKRRVVTSAEHHAAVCETCLKTCREIIGTDGAG